MINELNGNKWAREDARPPNSVVSPLRMIGRVQYRSSIAIVSIIMGIYGAVPSARAASEASASDETYYTLSKIPVPESVKLEVGGMTMLPDGRLGVATRRGEIWLVENPIAKGRAKPHFHRFAHGLQEPLGLAYKEGAFYVAQRGELTRLQDRNGDGRADVYESVVDWPMSGNHHAYSYGPKILPDGRLWLTFSLDSPERGMTRNSSLVKWRGWSVLVTPEGQLTPFATGMKAPAGFGLNAEGDKFYSENDGRWIGSGWISHVEKGDFLGHPAGLRWKDEPGSPVKMEQAPQDLPGDGRPMFEVAAEIPAFKLPAVWLPDGIMGSATLDILADTTHGRFGPFGGQLFVGDQAQNRLFRVCLEKIRGEYQGAVFAFRDGLAAGLVRQVWAPDGSMLLGYTDRGWPSSGEDASLQRLAWTGKTPFDIHSIHAKPDGFQLEFTKPLDAKPAKQPFHYQIQSFTYKYHEAYGSPTIRHQPCPIRGVKLASDRRSVRVAAHDLRRYYIHEITLRGIKAQDGSELRHSTAYYTLNRIPAGEPLSPEKMVTAEPIEPKATGPGRKEAQAKADSAAENDVESDVTGTRDFPPEEADTNITIRTRPGRLQYDTPSFSVPRGDRIRLTFENNDDLPHNIVFTLPGKLKQVAEEALALGLKARGRGYIPESPDVLYHTSLVQPGETETITFRAPNDPDSYPYVCTVPGHWQTMRGKMIVTQP